MINTTQSSEEIMHQVIEKFSKEKGFPEDYCNVASKELFDILKTKGKEVRLQFSYIEKGEGHRFVVEKDWDKETILDPTYAQYDKKYAKGFSGEKFPEQILEENRSEPEEFMELQKKWFEEWVYEDIFKNK